MRHERGEEENTRAVLGADCTVILLMKSSEALGAHPVTCKWVETRAKCSARTANIFCLASAFVLYVQCTPSVTPLQCSGVLAQQSHCQLNTVIMLALDTQRQTAAFDLHSKSPRTDRHGPHQRRPNALPKPSGSLLPPRLPKRIPHRLVPHLTPKAIALHLALNHIKRVTRYPECLARQTSVERDFHRRYVLALHLVALHVLVHEILECEKPHAVGLCFSVQCDRLAAVEASQHAPVGRELLDAVPWAIIQTIRAVRLRLQPDPDVFDGA
jgi:hypothetical protein